MNREKLEEVLEELASVGIVPEAVEIDDSKWRDGKLKNPEDVLGEYEGSEETMKNITISKVDFNKVCDTVIYNTEDLDFVDIITLARFTSAVRTLLFDRKNEEAEEGVWLTKSAFHEACDDAWEMWKDIHVRTREQKLATAEFIRALNYRIFKDEKTEKEEN